MKTISLPPLTRIAVIALVVLSIAASAIRYMEYSHALAVAKAPQVQPETDEHPLPERVLPRFDDFKVPYLTLIPGLAIVYPWTVITSMFVETTLFGFAITATTLAYGGRYCERVWSTPELARFLAIQAIVPNILTALIFAFIFTISRNEHILFESINGGIAIQIGFLVALKQLVPEHSLVLFRGAVKAQVKHLVFPYLILFTTIGLIMSNPAIIGLTWIGFLSSWIYLRFYRKVYTDTLPAPVTSTADQQTGASGTPKSFIRGDASEVFSLAHFFYPAPIRDVISSISQVVFQVLIAARICTPFDPAEVEAGNVRASQRAGNMGHSSSGDAEGDRRRALALRVLEERLERR